MFPCAVTNVKAGKFSAARTATVTSPPVPLVPLEPCGPVVTTSTKVGSGGFVISTTALSTGEKVSTTALSTKTSTSVVIRYSQPYLQRSGTKLRQYLSLSQLEFVAQEYAT